MITNDILYSDLPAKLHPFCLGHSKCTFEKINHEKILTIFKNSQEIKPNIFLSDDWIFKTPRLDFKQTPDTHLYRVLKAKKIRDYIQKNGLEEHIIVPKKFIIKNPDGSGLDSYIIVAEKMRLTDEVVKPTEEYESTLKKEDLSFDLVGQAKAFIEGKPQKELSLEQAKALANLAFLGYTDQTYNNVFFTPDGKVAILDTEPMHRHWKKQEKKFFNIYTIWKDKKSKNSTTHFKLNLFCNNWFGRLNYNETNEFGRKLSGIAYLKSYCTPNATVEVEKIQKNHYQSVLKKSITRCVVAAVTSIALPLILSAMSFTAPVIIPLCAASALKTLSSGLQTLQILGLNQLSQMTGAYSKFLGLIEIGCI